MRRTAFLLLAAVSLLACGHAAAATRPRYGGTLRIETRARLASLDPARLPADPGALSLAEKLFFLVGDRLVRIDHRGHLHTSLATGWHASAGDRRWTFDLRPDVKFQDGKPLVANDVVAALSARHPHWRLRAADMRVTIRLRQPAPHLLLTLALAENSILRMGQNGTVIGTGPFRVTQFTSSQVTLAANDNDWRGRPFLDGVEILMGRAAREQWIDLELGRADLVEIPPDRVHRARQSHMRVWASEPDELVALVFNHDRQTAQDAGVRQALANGVNRAALRDVLLQKQGTVARSILPAWLSGYAFLFAPPPTPASSPAAGPAPAAAPELPTLTLAYNSSDPLLASFAARIAVDARAVGIRLQFAPQASDAEAPADVRLVRQPIESLDPAAALHRMVSALGLENAVTVPAGASPEALYNAEQAIVSSHWVIPLVDVPEIYGLGPGVMDWMPPQVTLAGGWRLADVWKEPE